MRIMAGDAGEAPALLKAHRLPKAVGSAHDLEFVAATRARRMIEVNQKLAQGLTRTKRVHRPVESRNGLWEPRARGLEVALLADAHLQLG
jgi:hypothetical protein